MVPRNSNQYPDTLKYYEPASTYANQSVVDNQSPQAVALPRRNLENNPPLPYVRSSGQEIDLQSIAFGEDHWGPQHPLATDGNNVETLPANAYDQENVLGHFPVDVQRKAETRGFNITKYYPGCRPGQTKIEIAVSESSSSEYEKSRTKTRKRQNPMRTQDDKRLSENISDDEKRMYEESGNSNYRNQSFDDKRYRAERRNEEIFAEERHCTDRNCTDRHRGDKYSRAKSRGGVPHGSEYSNMEYPQNCTYKPDASTQAHYASKYMPSGTAGTSSSRLPSAQYSLDQISLQYEERYRGLGEVWEDDEASYRSNTSEGGWYRNASSKSDGDDGRDRRERKQRNYTP